MARAVASTLGSALDDFVVHPVYFVKMEMGSGDVYASSAPATISWNGFDWAPYGVTISNFSQGPNGAETATVNFPAYSNPMTYYLVSGYHVGRGADIYLSYVDDAGAVLDSPELILSGYMSGGSINDSGCSFSVIEEKSARYGKVPKRIFNRESGFKNLPRAGQVFYWKKVKFTLKSR